MNISPIPSQLFRGSWRVTQSPRAGALGLRAHSPGGNFCVEVAPGQTKGAVTVSFAEDGVAVPPAEIDADTWLDVLQVEIELVKRIKECP